MVLTLRRIKAYIRLMKAKRFLKKHHCRNWRQYKKRHDPLVNYGAGGIDDYYRGYGHIHAITDTKHYAYKRISRSKYGIYDILEWCEWNCSGEWRQDWHNVVKGDDGGWVADKIDGGRLYGDTPFFAFTDSRDALMFTLKWF